MRYFLHLKRDVFHHLIKGYDAITNTETVKKEKRNCIPKFYIQKGILFVRCYHMQHLNSKAIFLNKITESNV